jgi:hypothetical protein
MVEYQVGDTIFELLNNSSEKFSRAQAWILPTEHTECQAFCPVVRIGALLTRIVMLLPPFGSKGEIHSRVGEEVGGGGGPNSDEGTKSGTLCIL